MSSPGRPGSPDASPGATVAAPLGPAAVPVRRREHRLEPEHRAEHEQEEEAGPADVDAGVGAVGRAEAELRPRHDLEHEREQAEHERDESLHAPLRSPVGAMVREPEPCHHRTGDDAHDDRGSPGDGRVDALRPPHAVVVQRAEIEVREDEREEEERRRAREQVARGDEVPREDLRRLALDDSVLGGGMREARSSASPSLRVRLREPRPGRRTRRSRTGRSRRPGSW